MLDEKIKELIAVGASVGAHCQPCLTYHVARAKELGLKETEIREAIAIGHMVEKGSIAAMRQYTLDVLKNKLKKENKIPRKKKGFKNPS